MNKNKFSFKEIIDAYEAGGETYKVLAKKAPIHEVILNMVVNNHPALVVAVLGQAVERVERLEQRVLDQIFGVGSVVGQA